MNQDIIDDLETLRQRYEDEGDSNRERAYRRAIESIDDHHSPLESGKDAMKLKWVGKGIGWRVDLTLGTDTVGLKEETTVEQSQKKKFPKKKKNKDEVSSTVVPRMRVNFVGASSNRTSRASETRRTSEAKPQVRKPQVRKQTRKPQVRKSTKKPVPKESLLLPRETAEKLLNVVKNIGQKSFPDSHVVLADAYRLGHKNISRLVFLVTEKTIPKSTRRGEKVLYTILNTLTQSRLLRNVAFMSNSRNSAKGEAHFRSGHILPIWFICVPANEWPFALLRFTGPNDIWQQLQSTA